MRPPRRGPRPEGLSAQRRLLARARTVPAGPEGYAAWAEPDGTWVRRPGTEWSSGYAVGLRWLAGRPPAGALSGLELDGGPHSAFRAFRGWFGAGIGDVLHGDPHAAAAVVTAARALAADARPVAPAADARPAALSADDRPAAPAADSGPAARAADSRPVAPAAADARPADAAAARVAIVPLDEAVGERVLDDRAGTGAAETSIDAVAPVVALLVRAAEHTGDRALTELAAAHLRWHLSTLVRPDGSTAQYALLDPAGVPVEVRTGPQGLAPHSTWARSQAWALLAVATGLHRLPELRAELLVVADRLSAWWRAHVPADGIPRWDFAAPPGDPLDTSAAAIAAAAFARLPGGRNAAERLVDALSVHVTEHGLQHGCYHHRRRLAPSSELVWGDFHLLEAALLLDGDIPP